MVKQLNLVCDDCEVRTNFFGYLAFVHLHLYRTIFFVIIFLSRVCNHPKAFCVFSIYLLQKDFTDREIGNNGDWKLMKMQAWNFNIDILVFE